MRHIVPSCRIGLGRSARFVMSALLLLGSSVLLAAPAVAQGSLAERGRVIAETYCSQCHATGATDESPRAEAPPLRSFSERWDVEDLAEALAQGIMVGHDEMPEVSMTPSEIDAFLAYLESF